MSSDSRLWDRRPWRRVGTSSSYTHLHIFMHCSNLSSDSKHRIMGLVEPSKNGRCIIREWSENECRTEQIFQSSPSSLFNFAFGFRVILRWVSFSILSLIEEYEFLKTERGGTISICPFEKRPSNQNRQRDIRDADYGCTILLLCLEFHHSHSSNLVPNNRADGFCGICNRRYRLPPFLTDKQQLSISSKRLESSIPGLTSTQSLLLFWSSVFPFRSDGASCFRLRVRLNLTGEVSMSEIGHEKGGNRDFDGTNRPCNYSPGTA